MIAKSDAVYFVTASQSIDNHILFHVEEVLRGSKRTTLILDPYPSADKFFPESKWIIFRHQGGFPNCVGWAMKGDCEWLPISATLGVGTFVSGYRFSVDQIREYLKIHPATP